MTSKELNVKVYPKRVKRTVKHLKSMNVLKRNKIENRNKRTGKGGDLCGFDLRNQLTPFFISKSPSNKECDICLLQNISKL